MRTGTGSNNAGAVWNIDLVRTGTQFDLHVTDADTGSTIVRHGLRSRTPASVVHALEELTHRLGPPRGICTDCSTEFAGSFTEFLLSSGIEHHKVLPCSPFRRTSTERVANRS